MRIIPASSRAATARLAATDRSRDPKVRATAARIVRDVQRRGDAALQAWRRRLDRDDGPLEVDLGAPAIRVARARLATGVQQAIDDAIRRVERVAARQRPEGFVVTTAAGVRVEQRVAALGRVGCYIPGGRHPLPSTAIMTIVPARIAGVGEIIACCPAPTPAIVYAAARAGATRLFRMGGPHAIAALALGTRIVPRVDKIAGPGNAWVTAAKDLVAFEGHCAIDMHAGPSEIVIRSDRGIAAWIAADLIAQAEHDLSARAILVTARKTLARQVAAVIDARARGTAREALARHGAIVLARSRAEADDVVARLAPEHLVCDDPAGAARCGAAGTVFVGAWSAQAAGDYSTGSNHVLPTGGAARWRGGLSAADFVRVFTVQRVTRRGLHRIGPGAATLARAEGLDGHAASIDIRLGAHR